MIHERTTHVHTLTHTHTPSVLDAILSAEPLSPLLHTILVPARATDADHALALEIDAIRNLKRKRWAWWHNPLTNADMQCKPRRCLSCSALTRNPCK